MDPRAAKFESKRQPQDADQVSPRRTDRLFLSETIPPSVPLSHNRGHNLSDKIHEYYEKLMKNSQMKKANVTTQSRHVMHNLDHEFGVQDCTPVTVPMFGEQLHPSVAVRTTFHPTNSSTGQPYTVYAEDPEGSFQRHKKKSREKSKSPTNVNMAKSAECSFCHSSKHASQSCTLNSRVPAEQEGFLASPLCQISPPKHSLKASDIAKSASGSSVENQGDGLEERKTSLSYSSKRSIPPNISIHCQRDVIGQEKSPVSKSHPVCSAVLSTSSSNGDTVPRERKKWVRPPLVGQASSSVSNSPFVNPVVFNQLPEGSHGVPVLEKMKTSTECLQLSSSTGSGQTDSRNKAKRPLQPKSSYFDSSGEGASCLPQGHDVFYGGENQDLSSVASQQLTSEGEQALSDSCGGGRVSPSSSVTSSRRLEWDSGADVGYNQFYGSPNPDASSSGLCTIERMALAQGCSVALHLRLDPEGTTVPASSSGIVNTVLPSPAQGRSTPGLVGKPAAESTPVDQLPHLPKAIVRCRNHSKNVISPIFHNNVKESAEQLVLTNPVAEKKKEEECSSSKGFESSIVPVQRHLSNSMQDLRKYSIKQNEIQLFKSQSDPDLSGDSPTLVSKMRQSKYSKEICKGQIWAENVATNSVSSGSDATLVHVGTEEDLAGNEKGDNWAVKDLSEPVRAVSGLISKLNSGPRSSLQPLNIIEKQAMNSGKSPAENNEQDDRPERAGLPRTESIAPELPEVNQVKTHLNTHGCSDIDHKRGLHHHFGVLCSTVVGGHMQSSALPISGSPTHNLSQIKQHSRNAAPSPRLEESEVLTGESTGSSAFHSDAALEENAPCASTLTGRANSFEYLPGHVYENNSTQALRKHERPPGISTSTETDSEPVRPMSRVMRRKVIDSSSHDTEDDRLWASPRIGSNTLVQDIERGVSLLKGVMENKSASRRSKRELIRRIVKRLVTSEYVEDLVERERTRYRARSPFSPRKAKHQERSDRNLRSRRSVGPERQDISGESDDPIHQVHNVRRKLEKLQTVSLSQGHRIQSTLGSGSKSSSLWSSHADSTNGSISLSGSSDHQKESKMSVKPNPSYNPNQEQRADWLRPATQSEKLFEMRKGGISHAEKHLTGLMGQNAQEPVMDPVIFTNDPQKQLSWVKNEINHLKILKQLLQKQETLKLNLDPNLCQTTLTAMPVTGLKQTMQMADCTSPDIPEARSPKSKPSRLQQWISLESDTSAGFGLSNNTGSSHNSNWQETEVAGAGEQDNHPHRTVSISDGDQITDASCSFSNKKSECSQSSCPQRAQKSRHHSVSISDGNQLFQPSAADIPIQKKRSHCHSGNLDGRTYSARPAQVATYGPPPSKVSSSNHIKQFCDSCHTHDTRRDPTHSVGGFRSSVNNRAGLPVTYSNAPPANQRRTVLDELTQKARSVHSCSCGPATTGPTNSCSCGPPAGLTSQCTGAVKKATVSLSQQTVSEEGTELPSISSQPLSSGGLVRVHIETDQHLDAAPENAKFVRSIQGREKVNTAEVKDRIPILRSTSDDSLTRAVTEAVSSKVKALRNLGQIEEAEVKIRVKVGQGQVRDGVIPLSEKGRLLKTQDLEDDIFSVPSKNPEMDDMIARQRAMDIETRQKLLAIAESRQHAQMGMHDIDRRIQDLLLHDYLSRQFKTSEAPTVPQARLNTQVDSSTMHSNSVGVQSEVDKKTTGTSTVGYIDRSTQHKNDQSFDVTEPYTAQPLLEQGKDNCSCGKSSMGQSALNQGLQRNAMSIPQMYPSYCQCSCQSAPASSPRTYNASSVLSSPERQIEFDLELRKQRPYKLTNQEVHETLKSRNTAYFLQFEEDVSLKVESEEQVKKLPMEVVTIKVPKLNQPSSQILSKNRPVIEDGRRGADKIIGSQSNIQFPFSSSGGAFKSKVETISVNQGLSQQPDSLSNAKKPLRTTLGQSHLSITITDSSAESINSPGGSSRETPYQQPLRRSQTSPQPSGRAEKIQRKMKDGNVRQTSTFRTEGNKSLSSSLSALNLAGYEQSGRHHVEEGESVWDRHGDAHNTELTLQEYLEKNHPKYLDAAEKRRRCIAEMSYLRRLRQQSRKRLLELEGDKLRVKQKQQWRFRCVSRPKPVLKRKPNAKTIKPGSSRKYVFFPESQQRLAELKKKEEKRTNRLMAEIYTRKLQEKVLKGSATIRSSVSVISSY